jgi:predicted CoA-binding protein
MTIDGLTDDAIRTILQTTRRIAVVGASAKPDRPSFGVLGFLVGRGYAVVPVNPGLVGGSIHGQPVMATLDDAAPLEMVDVFRASDQVAPVVADAIRLGAKTVWMQLGVIDRQAAMAARDAGLTVVMDRCPVIESARLGLAAHP